MEFPNKKNTKFMQPEITTKSRITDGTEVSRVLVTDRDLFSMPIIDYFTSSQSVEVEIVVQLSDISSIVQTEKFDVILLDMTIPDIETLPLIKLIKFNNPGTIIIIIYDDKTIVSAIEVLSKGSFSPLKKPYNTHRLVSLLSEANVINSRDEDSIIDYCSAKASSSEDNPTHQDWGNSELLAEEAPAVSDELPTTPFITATEIEYRDKYHYMVETSPDIIFTINNFGIFTFVNLRVETLLGFDKSEMIGKHFFLLIYHEDIEDANAYFYEKNASDTNKNNIELRFKSRKGNYEPILFDIRVASITAQQIPIEKHQNLNDEELKVVADTYCVARDITERRKVEDRINHDAHHDCLTGLPDKILINDRIDAAIAQSKRSSKSFALMFLDLDGFKAVNDTYGHSIGDSLLQAVSARIKSCIREVDTLARVGGDEFMLLVTQIEDRADVSRIGEKVIYEIQKPYNLAGCELTLSASIGISLYPSDGESKDALISSADRSMYHIKRNNKNGFQLSSDM